MDQVIGGYFGEETLGKGNKIYHNQAIPLSFGRSSLAFILNHTQPKRLYLPSYSCKTIFDVAVKFDIPCNFYQIDQSLEPITLPELRQNEYILYINYFGVKSNIAHILSHKYQKQLIIDNTHAFFEKSYDLSWSFNSVRKFFGTTDGSYLYVPKDYSIDENIILRSITYSSIHLKNRLNGKLNEGYREYIKFEDKISAEIRAMSLKTREIMLHLNYAHYQAKRLQNFALLDQYLYNINKFKFDFSNIYPLCYPLLVKIPGLRDYLVANYIQTPHYWPEVEKISNPKSNEYILSKFLCPLPIDQRYGLKEMGKIIRLVEKYVCKSN